MTTNYPGALDNATTLPSSYTDATPTDVEHAAKHNNIADAIIAVETELGVNPSGTYNTVGLLLASLAELIPTASQNVQPTGDFIPLILQAHATQSVAMFQIKANGGTVLGSITETGAVDAVGYQLSGGALASNHLANASSILKNPSPSITTPSISDAAMTGSPVAPTPSTSDSSTKVATTAFVIAQAYAKLANPALTGTPTAPTASVDTNTTQIATTEFVINQIEATPAAPPVTGIMLAYAGSSAPSGWLLCDGTAVNRTTYADLFTAIGTAYGVGDGSTTFNLPDLRGRIPWGKGTHADIDTLGENDGVAVANRRPKHAHSTSVSASVAGGHSHGGGTSGSSGSHSHSHGTAGGGNSNGGTGGTAGFPSGTSTSSSGSHSHSFSNTSSNGAHTHGFNGNVGSTTMIEPPYYVLNYIIKT